LTIIKVPLLVVQQLKHVPFAFMHCI